MVFTAVLLFAVAENTLTSIPFCFEPTVLVLNTEADKFDESTVPLNTLGAEVFATAPNTLPVVVCSCFGIEGPPNTSVVVVV